jgi:hypothetical protein
MSRVDGMARFLQQFGPGQGDDTTERSRILGNPSVDEVMDDRTPAEGTTAEVIVVSIRSP